MQSRIRVAMLGLLAVMLAGSIMASTASATAGPFWHHRAVGGEGEGAKIEPAGAESFKGEGGEQILAGKLSTEPVEIVSKSVQVKGAIFNNALQGQIKLELIYNQPTLVKPALKECTVVVGEKNIVVVKGHLMWKWNGEKKQLEEPTQEAQKPDLAFTPAEIAEGATTLPTGVFTTITLKGSGCGVLAGTFKVEGSDVGLPSPSNVKEWSTKLSVRTIPGENLLQHFWNGKEFIGAKVGLIFGGNTSSLIGQTKTTANQQEIAVFEK
jgi:hypothetical protein